MKKRPDHSRLMQACWEDPDWAEARRKVVRAGVGVYQRSLTDQDRAAISARRSAEAKARWQNPTYRALVESRKAEGVKARGSKRPDRAV